ncbi:MAG: protein phosphatase 2C domain-containing protein [Clostridiales Family XIII bacterium]|jgi:serine/threonine protein phosphatase PrpC|nr:protein phosphatase 2C domain-containing protein [Clostridiales Family XIII bacterium]
MNIRCASLTDVGTRKDINQDSFCLKAAETPQGNVVFALICDGVGGMAKGEVASGYTTGAFSSWFDEEIGGSGALPNAEHIRACWLNLMMTCNESVLKHGQKGNIRLGTTATALFVLPDGEYVAAHIGDSRIFLIENGVKQLTADHTLVAAEVLAGRMSPTEAASDARKSVLTQCIGSSTDIMPDFFEGKAKSKDMFLICSDGFSNRVSEAELHKTFAPLRFGTTNQALKNALAYVAGLCKERGERDNITGVVISLS